MKKTLSMMLALLMLALPVFSMAEGISGLGASTIPDLSKKYTDAGQKSTVTVTFEPGELLPVLAGDESMGNMVTDLLKALGIRVDSQSLAGTSQSEIALQLDGEDALVLTFASAADGLYARTSLTGEDVFAITPDELKTLLESLAQQMEASGSIPEGALSGFLADPSSAMAGMESMQLDTTGLQTALMPIIAGIKSEEVTEAPAEFPEAKTVMIVRITKEDMNNVLTEAAKLVWQIPVVQQMSGYMSGSGEPMTEEKLIEAFTSYPSMMKDDAVLQIYLSEAGDKTYATYDSVIATDDAEITIRSESFTAMADGATTITNRTKITSTESTEIQITAFELTASEGKMDFHMAASSDLDGDVWTIMDMNISTETAASDTEVSTRMESTFRVSSERGADPVGVFFNMNTEEKDLGDHAEAQGSLVFGLENAGNLLTVNFTAATADPDALIVTPDAIHPMAMSEEELNSLGSKLMGSVMAGISTLMQKLPPSILQLMSGAQMQ